MENKEFNYKKYLANNPLLEGEIKENTFDPEVARGINSDVRKALDDFYENGDGLELAYAIEDIMFGGVNEEEITEEAEPESHGIDGGIRDIIERIQTILKGEHQPHVIEKYIESVVRDIKINPEKEGEYYSEDREFFIEDFENFVADRM